MEDRINENQNEPKEVHLSKKHLVAYIAATIILLLGAIIAGVDYNQNKNISAAIKVFKPFFIVSVETFLYFRLTQETKKRYAIKSQRAIFYCVAAGVLLQGLL